MKLEKAFDIIDMYEETKKVNVKSLVQDLEKGIRKEVSSSKLLTVKFEKGYGDTGVIFVKYANVEKGASEQDANNANTGFMISIEGFNGKGEIDTKDGKVFTDVFKFKSSTGLKKMKKVKGQPEKVVKEIIKYFKDNIGLITKITEEIIGGETADGGAVTTDSPTSTKNIAVHKKPLEDEEDDGYKDDIEDEVEESDNPFTSINQEKPKKPKKKKGLI